MLFAANEASNADLAYRFQGSVEVNNN